MSQLKSWAHILGGSICGRSVSCPGPGHSRGDRSLSVTLSAKAPDGFLVHSHAGDDPITCKDYVRSRLGMPGFSPSTRRDRIEIQPRPAGPPDNTARTRNALRTWAEARDPRGTLVEQYLKLRGLDLPCEAAGEAIRFLDRCKFDAEYHPAIICLVGNVVTNEPQAVHRTALAPNGTAIKRAGKTYRLSLGPISGGAIKLDPDEDVTQGLCIGEGVETCLSGRQIGLNPVWSAVSTGGIANFPVLPGIDGMHIFKENDTNGASERDVKKCASRWYEAGRSVLIVTPDVGKDLNDEITRKAQAAQRQR
jgi:putative DNA primase/helicase